MYANLDLQESVVDDSDSEKMDDNLEEWIDVDENVDQKSMQVAEPPMGKLNNDSTA